MILPAKIFEQHIIALGKTRSGKSSVMRLLVEGLLNRQDPVSIIDPKGDWWGLKASASGKKAGYPIVILGGDHSDVPLNSKSGGAVAELVATGNRPCIIDLGGWMPSARTEFFIDFASTFFRTMRGRRYLVIDEVHNFAPKGKIMDPQAGKMLHWANRLASEGLGKGVSLLAASQRPQKVHNDFLTSCETLIAMRVIHPSDRKAISEWIDGCADPDKAGEVMSTLASMKRGEAWVWSPEAEFGPKRIQFPLFSTYDSFKPQKAGQPAKLKGWADVDLAEVTKKLEAAVKEAQANDPKKLQARVRELEAELRKRGAPADVSRAPAVDERALRRTIERSVAETTQNLTKQLVAANHTIVKFQRVLAKIALEAADLAKVKVVIEMPKVASLHVPVPAAARKIEQAVESPRVRRTSVEASRNGDDLAPGEIAILKAAAQYPEGVERDQLAVLTGYRRSSRDTYVARLRTKGLLEDNGGRIRATPEGVTALGDNYEPLPSGPELQEYLKRRLPRGELKILQILIDAHGEPVPREAIDAAANFRRSSRDTYLSRLAARKLVEPVGRGEVRASPHLF